MQSGLYWSSEPPDIFNYVTLADLNIGTTNNRGYMTKNYMCGPAVVASSEELRS